MTLHPLAFLLIYAACMTAGYLVGAIVRGTSTEDAYNAGYLDGKNHALKPDPDIKGQSHVNWRSE